MSDLLTLIKSSKCGAVVLKTYSEEEILEVDAWLKQYNLVPRETIFDSLGKHATISRHCRLSFLCTGGLDLDIWAGTDNNPYFCLEKGSQRIMVKWRGKPIFSDWLGYKLGRGLEDSVDAYNREAV